MNKFVKQDMIYQITSEQFDKTYAGLEYLLQQTSIVCSLKDLYNSNKNTINRRLIGKIANECLTVSMEDMNSIIAGIREGIKKLIEKISKLVGIAMDRIKQLLNWIRTKLSEKWAELKTKAGGSSNPSATTVKFKCIPDGDISALNSLIDDLYPDGVIRPSLELTITNLDAKIKQVKDIKSHVAERVFDKNTLMKYLEDIQKKVYEPAIRALKNHEDSLADFEYQLKYSIKVEEAERRKDEHVKALGAIRDIVCIASIIVTDAQKSLATLK